MPPKKLTQLSDNFKENFLKEVRMVIATNPDIKTESAFAKKMNISMSAISSWKAGRYPTIEQAVKMRMLFGTDINAIIDGKKPVKSELEKRIEKIESMLNIKDK